MSIIGVGSKFPSFSKKVVVSIETGKEFSDLTSDSLSGKWTVMFWWPKDFTFVCPTEIAEFDNAYEQFAKAGAQLIGASTDSEFVHLAWRNSHTDLKDLHFPMLADTSKSLAEELGILEKDERVAYRATYIIDKDAVIRWVCINDLSVGRNVGEVVRVLNALQTGALTPCNWRQGDATL